MAAGGHFCSPIFAKIDVDLLQWYVNGYIKYEVDRLISEEVMACTIFVIILSQNGRHRPFWFPIFVQTKTIIFPKFQISGI